MEASSTNVQPSVEILIEEMEPLVMDGEEFQCQNTCWNQDSDASVRVNDFQIESTSPRIKQKIESSKKK